jgi:hypothetical protein
MALGPYVMTASGVRGMATATVRSAARSVEGVPPEFAGYVGRTIRLAEVKTFTVEISVLGAGCDGGWATIEVTDLEASGNVCASWSVGDGRPGWARRLV